MYFLVFGLSDIYNRKFNVCVFDIDKMKTLRDLQEVLFLTTLGRDHKVTI